MISKKNTKILTVIVIVFILSSSVSAVALAATKFNVLTANGVLYTSKESEFSISTSLAKEMLTGIQLTDDKGNIVATDFDVDGKKLTIKPLNNLVSGKKYIVKIFTSDNKKFKLSLTAKDDIFIDNNKDSIIRISANPEKGFNYPYYLLVPKGIQYDKSKKFMVVEPNNTGFPSDSLEVHEIAVRIHLHDYGYTTGGAGGYQVATELRTPLLIPVFPRPTTEDNAGIYTHALDREAMLVKGVDYERVDLQLKSMIKDAQVLLSNNGVEIEKKVLMVGFSASGDFVNRFMFMYPEMIKAVATSTSSIFPAEKYNGVTLDYPLGIADIQKFTGAKFNSKEYEQVAKFMYIGENDRNDMTQEWDKNGEAYVKALFKVFKDESFPYKWNRKVDIINELGYGNRYQFHIYKGIGHGISYSMFEDIVAFFKANLGNKFNEITPHEFGE